MLDAKLFRFQKKSTHTLGALVIGGKTFYVLERPWLNNAVNRSCIPTGKYVAHYMPRSGSGRYKEVYHILPVDGRTGILIHTGNLVRHSLGCLLIGSSFGALANQTAVLNSRKAKRELNDMTGHKSFNLEIL
ncbi:hypothetical protein vBAmePPT11V19_00008 [Alteromonas phage vB_AmeP_PT11-V19]|nr:hypothetical protein vBAmePPT11V19_00008 [Alteromonas phage vB_AmeP_PT11-V19]